MAQQFLGQDGPQGGLGAAAVRARNKRRREGYAKLMDALDDDSCRDLKKDMRTNARGNGRAAFIILERECSENNSDLDQGAKITEWWGLTVEKDIGIKKSCLIEFNRLLTAKNSELTAPFDMDKWTEKFLQSIKRPSALATQARSLLATPAAHRPAEFYDQAVAAAGGLPAVPAGWRRAHVVEYFDEMFDKAFEAGDDGLRYHAPTAGQRGPRDGDGGGH